MQAHAAMQNASSSVSEGSCRPRVLSQPRPTRAFKVRLESEFDSQGRCSDRQGRMNIEPKRSARARSDNPGLLTGAAAFCRVGLSLP